MKKIYFLFVFFCFSVAFLSAQNTQPTKNSYLPTSSTGSQIALIYKLKDSKKVFEKEDIIELLDQNKTDFSSFMTLVDSIPLLNESNNTDFPQKIDYGYYLTVWTVEEILKVRLTTVAPINVVLQSNAKRAWLVVYDSLGNELPNLKIKLNNQTLSYNKKLKSYILPNGTKEANVEIKYADETWRLFATSQNNYRRGGSFLKKVAYSFPIKYFWVVPRRQIKKTIQTIRYRGIEKIGIVEFFVSVFDKDTYRKDDDDKYRYLNGYIVTDKLKYRPLDTLRFKTYLVDKKGKPISNEEINVFIANNDNIYKQLQSVKAYRKGGFEGQIILTDSLQLKLGNYVRIILEDKKGEAIISERITYEDYVLPEIKSVEVETTEKNHYRNTPFALRIITKDFNNLTVLDGKIEVELTSKNLKTTYEPSISQQPITWKYEQNLEPFGETLIYVPDSIFPAADLVYEVKVVVLNSNNERIEKNISIDYDYFTKKPNLEARFEDGFVYAIYREGKDTVSKKGVIHKYFTDNFNNQDIKVDSVLFPFKEKVNAIYERVDFVVDTDLHGNKSFIQERVNIPNSVNIDGYFLYDSLIMTIQNPFKSVVRYSIFCKNKLIERKADSSSTIRIAIKDKHKKVYIIQTSHTFGGRTYEEQEAFLRNRKQLFVSLDAPLLTCPSFKEKINVTVKDYKKRPVKNADLTVVATNGKFGNYKKVNIENSQRSRFRFKSKKKLSTIGLKNQNTTQEDKLANHLYWKNRFGLDSIAYYNFIFPKKEGFRLSIPYPTLQNLAKTNLKNVNSANHIINHLEEEFFVHHNPDKGALFLAFFDKTRSKDISWIKIDDSLAYLSEVENYQDHLITLSEGIHKLEIRLQNSIVYIDSISVPMGNETVLSLDLDNLPAYAYKVAASSKLYDDEILMIASHTFLAVMYGDYSSYENIKIQQGKNEIQEIKFKSDYNAKLQKYRYEWKYPLLHKGEFRILRTRQYKWDTLYFEPFVAYDIEESKYILKDTVLRFKLEDGRDTILYSASELKVGEITTNKTLWKANFFPTEYIKTNKPYKMMYSNYIFPFFDYSKFRSKEYKEQIYKWITPQFEVTAKKWDNLVFKDSDSLSKNFEKEYVFHNLVPFQGKLPAGTYQVLIYYLDYYKGACQKIDSLHIKEDSSNPSLIDIDFEKMGIDCNQSKEDKAQQILEELKEIRKIYQEKQTDYKRNYNRMWNEKLYTGKVIDYSGEPLPGATVQIKGTNTGTTTDLEGNYSIIAPIGSILIFRFVGYKIVQKEPSKYDFVIDVIMEDNSELSEVVVTSYTPLRKKDDIAYSISQISGEALMGSASGIEISKNNLLLSNSLTLESKNLDLKDDFNQNKKKNIRNYFTDNAIWQPKLKTDKNGKASFEVTYPDDITSWKTLAIAYGENNQNGQALVQTNSFLTLSGQLSLPRFLIEGDSVRIIGKIASYSSDSIKVNSYFDLEGKKIPQKERKVLFSSVDSLRFSVADNSSKIVDLSIDSLTNLQDSLTIQYVMNADIAKKQIYTDGEERKIPILKKGLLKRRGFFAILEGDTTLDLRAFKDSLSTQNPVKLYIKDNMLEAMVSELEHIQDYPYACNEQKASKIRAYMLEKEIKTTLNLPFEKKKQRELEGLIKKLVKTQYSDGWWGWWATSIPNTRMTTYIYSVLYDAKEKGYDVPAEILLNTETILIKELAKRTIGEKMEIYTLLAKNKIYKNMYKDSVEKLAVTLQFQYDTSSYKSFYNQLSILRLKQLYDLPISLRILDIKQKKTQFGGVFWQEIYTQSYYYVFRNDMQLTLLAYQLLRDEKTKSKYSIDLGKIRQFFLESRGRDGYWRSTYESASILATILPDFESKSKPTAKAELLANNNNLMSSSEYLFSKEDLPTQITKKGLAPIFVSLSQDYFVAQAAQKTSDDFYIKTYFKDANSNQTTKTKSDSIYITAGKPLILTVEVTVQKESEYVSIEVPIPASCVYGKNLYSLRKDYYYYYRGIETYREEFKHKTVIFCTKIPIGTHTFEIILEPRYSGIFTLNPASVELMYFPNISGNEETKKVFVE